MSNVALRLLMRKGGPTLSPYAAAIMADSPALYWRLGDASKANNATAADSSGNNRPGTYKGSSITNQSSLVSGDADTAAGVTATTGYIERAYESWMDDTTFTVECIATFSGSASYQALISADGYTTRAWVFYFLSGKLHAFNANNGGGLVTGATTLSGTYHVAMRSDGSTVKLYVNGTEDGSANVAMSNPSGSDRKFQVAVAMAGTPSPTLGYTGTIDEVAYFPTALTQPQIDAHATAAGY